MPVIFNEPLSFLQRMTEYMEYARLIRVASEQEDPIERMKYIAGKLISPKSFDRIINQNHNFFQDLPFPHWLRIGSVWVNHSIHC